MISIESGDCLAAEVQMLMTSDSVRGCLIGPPLLSPEYFPGTVRIPVSEPRALRECIFWLRRLNTLQLSNVRDVIASEQDYYIASRRSDTLADIKVTQDIVTMSAAQFAGSTKNLRHLTISEMDISAANFSKSAHIGQLQSLDISRLQLDSDLIVSLVQSAHFRNLRWLDLSGNPNIGFSAIQAIAAAVASGRLPCLQWLDLLGTDYDATPYVDGCYWRISELAKSLATQYGYQPWMMLGSRIPELENNELLTSSQRQVPPDRFN